MTLLKDNNYKEINVALLSLEADIKNKITNFDTSVIDKQLVEINSRIDKINAGDNNTSAAINDIRYEIENINSKVNGNSVKIENIEQKLSDIFSAENRVTDFNTTTNSGIYYWVEDAANKPGPNYGVLLVNKHDDGSNSIWINQIAYGTNNKIYFRQNINSGSWTEWKAVAFDGELNADTVDNYHASQLWRSDGATWNPSANVTMTPSGNDNEWSFDFRNKNGAAGSYWQVWDENKQTLLKVNADDGKVSAPYGFVGNLSGNVTGNKLTIQGGTVSSNSYTDTNPKLEFKNIDGSQNISLTFTDWDAVQEPASLTLNGNQGNEYFIAPNIKATGNFYGNLSGKADTAGTADYAKNMYSQFLDLTSLDKTKFYPLVCYSGIDFAEVAICSESGMASIEYNQNRIHFDISTQGWSDLPPTLNIREYACYDNNEVTIGCIGRGVHNGAWAIWLRGGLHYTCFSRNSDLSLKTSDYTYGDEVYTIGTNYYGGSNTNVDIWFTPQSTIKDGAYISRQITATEIKANNRMVIPIGAPSSLEDGCIWIER